VGKYSIEDPVTYEIFKHRLWAINERSHNTLGKVSGSPIVVDGHEYLCCIHKANGDAALVNSGVLYHLIGMEFAVKDIIEWTEKEGITIEEGDQFLTNDPFIASMHTLDMGIMKPVFYEGRIVAWVASLFHTAAVPSSMQPAGYSPSATVAYQEGFRAQGLKIVSRGRQCAEIFRNLMANTRDPDSLGLDHISKIAANNVASNDILKMIDEFGVDYINQAFDRMIDETEAMCRKKIRELPNGKWETVLYLDTTGIEIKPRKVQTTLIKEGDRLFFDYEGTDPQEPGSVQCAFPAGISHIFVVLASQLFWDVPWNSGILRSIEYNLPKGSLVNVDFPYAVSHSVITITPQNTAHRCIAHMQFLKEELRQDINAGWAGGGSPKFAGIDQRNRVFGTTLMTAFAAGNGARIDMDGVNTGGLMLTPESEIANVETHEMFYPLLYLWRREAQGSQGLGKLQGGVGLDQAFITHDAPEGFVTGLGIPIGDTYTFSHGLFGGYPGGLRKTYRIKKSNVNEILAKGEIPSSIEEIQGEKEFIQVTVGTFRLEADEVVQYLVAGGGGYGDPLDRDPVLVLRDIQSGNLSTLTAENVYGVVMERDGNKVNSEATERRRKEIIADRLRRGKSFKKHTSLKKWRIEELSDKGNSIQITEYLWLAEKEGIEYIICGSCGCELCENTENYKLHALCDERIPDQIGLAKEYHQSTDPNMVYREFYCPGCGKMLDIEPTVKGSPVLHDIQLSMKRLK